MTTMTVQKAVDYFEQGYSCSQSIALAFLGDIINTETILRFLSAFGGGMGRTGQTCGAISGGMAVLGFYLGQTSPQETEKKEALYSVCQNWMAEFQKAFDQTTCNGLLGFDIGNPSQRLIAKEQGVFSERCPSIVRKSAEVTGAILDLARK
jgi:C_GCAxxG_C_C family probable redox protein